MMKNGNKFMLGGLLIVFIVLGVIWKSTFGIINSATYAYSAYLAGLNGEVMLNGAFYLPIQFIGLYLWNKHSDAREVEIENMKNSLKYVYAVGTIIGIIGLGLFLKTIDGQVRPFLDATTTILSVAAQFMMLQRFYQQWYLYVAINILSIGMWLYVGDSLMVLMWIAYLCNSVLGLYTWKKGSEENGK